ncbi:MAG: T9SS type A sorting domain-containing protein, partial [Bacteroidaceae bacterium]|nr:T9SS type A sorting domain-containing protein [Bacteroidaceae bacterium]
KPVVTYSEGYLIISVPEASVSYPLSNLQKFTFGDVDDQVTRIVAPVNTAPQPTYIYSLDGKLMRTLQPSEDGTTSASLEGLPSGTYVVKNGKTSYKVLKR